MRKPFDGEFPVTQYFGEKITDPAGHTGIDYALYLGTPVLAAMNGKVIRVSHLATGYGTHVLLEHEGGLQTIYAHLSSVNVSIGTSVSEGQEIGRSGNTGNSTGPHLHFEVRRFGKAVDPEEFLKTSGTAAERNCRVTVPELYIRSGPGTEYAIVGSLKHGERVRGEQKSETIWLRIGPARWIAIRYQGKDFCETIQ